MSGMCQYSVRFFVIVLKATTGVREACLNHACKACLIAAIPSQTYGNGRDEPHLSPIGHLDDYHYLFPYVCDGTAAMKQGLQAWPRWASQTPVVALRYNKIDVPRELGIEDVLMAPGRGHLPLFCTWVCQCGLRNCTLSIVIFPQYVNSSGYWPYSSCSCEMKVLQVIYSKTWLIPISHP